MSKPYQTTGDYVANLCKEAIEVRVPREVTYLITNVLALRHEMDDAFLRELGLDIYEDYDLACHEYGEYILRTPRGMYRLVDLD